MTANASTRPRKSTTPSNGAYPHQMAGRRYNIITDQTFHGPIYRVVDGDPEHPSEYTICRSITKSYAERVCQRENERNDAAIYAAEPYGLE